MPTLTVEIYNNPSFQTAIFLTPHSYHYQVSLDAGHNPGPQTIRYHAEAQIDAPPAGSFYDWSTLDGRRVYIQAPQNDRGANRLELYVYPSGIVERVRYGQPTLFNGSPNLVRGAVINYEVRGTLHTS